MKILDRYIIRNFLTSALVWFVVFMSLRTLADLFVNMDEFAKQNKKFIELLGIISSYYSYQMLVYFTELGGVIITAAAAFSLATMNRTNELTAMLASGVSLYRVVVPIVLCSLVLSGLIVLDQELLIPQVADKLVRSRDDTMATNAFQVRLMPDSAGSIWFSNRYQPTENKMDAPLVLLRNRQLLVTGRLSGSQARATELDGHTGWMFQEGVYTPLASGDKPWENPPKWTAVYSAVDPNAISTVLARSQNVDPSSTALFGLVRLEDKAYNILIEADVYQADAPRPMKTRQGRLQNARFTFTGPDGTPVATFMAASAVWQRDSRDRGYWELAGGTMFVPSDMTPEDLVLRRSSHFLEFMSSADLVSLNHLHQVPDLNAVLLTRHVRLSEPVNHLIMLLLGLPFILSRERNIKASATLCLLTVGVFYAFIYICRYMGLPPTLAAFLPALLFGPIAALMLDTIKT